MANKQFIHPDACVPKPDGFDLGRMLQELDELRELDPDSLNEWAFNFIQDMAFKYQTAKEKGYNFTFSEKQAEKIVELYVKHLGS